jgi:hypothetical protein
LKSASSDEIREADGAPPCKRMNLDPPAVSLNRYRNFIKVMFNYCFLMKKPHCIDKEHFKIFMASLEEDHYISAEVDDCLKKLEDENKVMLSDGDIFILNN